MILTKFEAIVMVYLAAVGLLATIGLIFTYFILYANRAERRMNGCDYSSNTNNDTSNVSNAQTDN